jgi:hypothetical protein
LSVPAEKAASKLSAAFRKVRNMVGNVFTMRSDALTGHRI